MIIFMILLCITMSNLYGSELIFVTVRDEYNNDATFPVRRSDDMLTFAERCKKVFNIVNKKIWLMHGAQRIFDDTNQSLNFNMEHYYNAIKQRAFVNIMYIRDNGDSSAL